MVPTVSQERRPVVTISEQDRARRQKLAEILQARFDQEQDPSLFQPAVMPELAEPAPTERDGPVPSGLESGGQPELAGAVRSFFGEGNEPSTGAQPANLPADQTERGNAARDYLLKQHGFTPHAAAAVVGHGIQESNLRPSGAVGDNGTAHGIYQWRGDRFANLQRFAQSQGKDWQDFHTQLDFMVHELGGSERFAGDALRNSQNLEDATAAFMHFERPAGYTRDNPQGGHGFDNRLRHARTFLDGADYPQIQNMGVRPGSPPVIQGGGAPSTGGASPQNPIEQPGIPQALERGNQLAGYFDEQQHSAPSTNLQTNPQQALAQAIRTLARPAQIIVNSPEERGSAIAPEVMQGVSGSGGRQRVVQAEMARQARSGETGPVTAAYTGAGRSSARGLIPRILDQKRMQKEGEEMVQQIMARPNNTYTAAQLNSQRPDVLRRILLTQPKSAAELERERLELQALRKKVNASPTTDDITEFNFAKQGGYDGSFEEWMAARKSSLVTNNIGPTGIDYGKPESGLAWARNTDGTVKLDERGAPIAVPYEGGSVQREEQEAEQRALNREQQKAISNDIVLDDVERGIEIAKKSEVLGVSTATGFWGGLLEPVGGSDSRTLKNLLDSVKANVGFDRLQQMREASPTGGALGPVSDNENRLLQSTLGSLEKSGNRAEFLYNLNRLRNVYLDTIHGPGLGPERRNFNPKTEEFMGPAPGTIVDGFYFKGGDPNDRDRWVELGE